MSKGIISRVLTNRYGVSRTKNLSIGIEIFDSERVNFKEGVVARVDSTVITYHNGTIIVQFLDGKERYLKTRTINKMVNRIDNVKLDVQHLQHHAKEKIDAFVNWSKDPRVGQDVNDLDYLNIPSMNLLARCLEVAVEIRMSRYNKYKEALSDIVDDVIVEVVMPICLVTGIALVLTGVIT